MAKAGNEPAERPAASSSWSRRRTRGCRPTTRCSGRSTKRHDVVERIGQLGIPASGGAGTPLKPVVIEEATVRER